MPTTREADVVVLPRSNSDVDARLEVDRVLVHEISSSGDKCQLPGNPGLFLSRRTHHRPTAQIPKLEDAPKALYEYLRCVQQPGVRRTDCIRPIDIKGCHQTSNGVGSRPEIVLITAMIESFWSRIQVELLGRHR